MGIVSLSAARKGTCLGEYRGQIITVAEARTQADNGNRNDYLFEVRKLGQAVHVIDAQDPSTASWVRYVNAAGIVTWMRSPTSCMG